MAQGFHLARPCDVEAMETLLASGGLDPAQFMRTAPLARFSSHEEGRSAAARTLDACSSAKPCVNSPSRRRVGGRLVVPAPMPASGPLTAEVKSPGDYVTEVDRAAEQAAIECSVQGRPTSDPRGGGRGDPSERMWVVDPIDGTTNFVSGFPVVGVSVALVEEGRPVWSGQRPAPGRAVERG